MILTRKNQGRTDEHIHLHQKRDGRVEHTTSEIDKNGSFVVLLLSKKKRRRQLSHLYLRIMPKIH